MQKRDQYGKSGEVSKPNGTWQKD